MKQAFYDFALLVIPTQWRDWDMAITGFSLYAWLAFLALATLQMLYERLVDIYWLNKLMK